MSDGRRYTDEETRRILDAAARLELARDREAGVPADGEAHPPGSEGHSLAEIRSIAEEAGIDPRMVDRAAASLRTVEDTRGWSLLGAPTSFRFVQEVQGVVPYEEIPRVLDVVRRTRVDPPAPYPVAGGMEWRAGPEMGGIRAAVVRKGGRTEIELFLARERQTVRLLAASALLVFLVAAAVGGVVPQGAAYVVLAGWAAGTVVAGRALARWQADRVERSYQPLIDRMAGAAASLAEPYRPPPSSSDESDESTGSTNR